MSTSVPVLWQTVRNFIWLVFGAFCLLLALIFWVSSQSKHNEVEVVEIEQQAQEAARPVQSEKLGVDSSLGSFIGEVRPIVLKQHEVSGVHHEAEFRGSKFLSEKEKFWTLQLMKVSEEDVIRSYLDKRDDRKKFQYFRLQGEAQSEMFVLTYGSYNSVNDVLDQTAKIDFQLPKGIKTSVEKFSSYKDLVNDLGTDEMSSGLKLRVIRLTKAALPVIPVRPTVPEQAKGSFSRNNTSSSERDPSESNTQNQNRTPTISNAPSSEQKTLPSTRPQHNNETQVVDPF